MRDAAFDAHWKASRRTGFRKNRMADIIHLHRTAHEDAQLLLPWYVNQTLTADEAAMVEAHLRECADCRHDFETESELARDIAAHSCDGGSDWMAPNQRPDWRLRRPASVPFLRRRVPLGWLVVGQLAIATALGLAIYAPSARQAPGQTYEALGSDVQQSGNLVVVFQPERSERDMRAALLAANAQIVDGPNASGAYVLSVPQAQRREALNRLRSLPQVVLAEPIDPGGER